MMKKINAVLAAATIVAGLGVAGSANAAVFATFTPGASVSAGYAVVQSFNNTVGGVAAGMSGTYAIHAASPNDSTGAAPSADGTSYLTVLANRIATYTFAAGTTSVQFNWGTASSDNVVTFFTTAGNFTYSVPNSTKDVGDANYNLNGLLTATADVGLITGLQFTGTRNSFEVDNIAAAVPEPSTWALMLGGFGMVGMAMRRRRATKTIVRYA